MAPGSTPPLYLIWRIFSQHHGAVGLQRCPGPVRPAHRRATQPCSSPVTCGRRAIVRVRSATLFLALRVPARCPLARAPLAEDGCAGALPCTRTPVKMRTSDQIFFLFNQDPDPGLHATRRTAARALVSPRAQPPRRARGRSREHHPGTPTRGIRGRLVITSSTIPCGDNGVGDNSAAHHGGLSCQDGPRFTSPLRLIRRTSSQHRVLVGRHVRAAASSRSRTTRTKRRIRVSTRVSPRAPRVRRARSRVHHPVTPRRRARTNGERRRGGGGSARFFGRGARARPRTEG